MIKDECFYYESRVAEKLALTRDDVRYLRTELLEKNEWCRLGNYVVLTAAALRRILEHLDVADALPDLTTCEVEKEKPMAIELTVKKLCANPRLLQALLPAADGEPESLVMVRVPSNENFRPKMKIKARPPALLTDAPVVFYQLDGRCPRYPGRY